MTQAASEDVWRTRLAAWRASGQSAERFAKDGGFSPTSLWKWQKRLGEPAPARFVQLVRKTPSSGDDAPPVVACGDLVVEVGGARVHVTHATDEALLRRVVRVLGGAS